MSLLRPLLLAVAGTLAFTAGTHAEEPAGPGTTQDMAPVPAGDGPPTPPAADTTADSSPPDPAPPTPATGEADVAPLLPAAGQPDAPGTTDTRMAARSRFLRLMDDGSYAEAAVAGSELVELTRAEFGDGSIRLVTPLTNLGTARLRAGDLAGAEAGYQAAVDLVEDLEGILSRRLENPLLGLGETYMRSERYPQATAAYERALRVSQVNEGLYNLEQVPIRDGLSEGYLQQGDLEKANFHQEAQIDIASRRVGTDTASVTPALYKLGRWYARSGQPERARFAYQRAARMIEGEKGSTAPELVEALLAMGDTYREQALLPPDPNRPESPLSLLPMSSAMYRRALAVIDRQPEPDMALRGRAYASLGDLYMLWNRRTTALQAYGNAWTVLSAEDLLDQRDAWFGRPERLMGTDPPTLYPRSVARDPAFDRRKLLPGFVLVRFAVEPTGRATDVAVIESDPPGLLDAVVADAVSGSLFRPRLAEGQPVRADGITYRHEFRYAETRLKPKAAPIPEGGRLDAPERTDLPVPPAGADQPPPAPAAPAGEDAPIGPPPAP
ncbi:MAG: energy transducer TonB [Chromatiales bacterium]|nr:energy transducer TonB [Chromatiales bacterium]